MNAPRPRLVSRIWDQVPRAPEPDRIGDLRRQAWHGLGLLIVDPEDLGDLERQLALNIGNRLYGRRGRR